jgi:S-adenosylmethionine decarboxylase
MNALTPLGMVSEHPSNDPVRAGNMSTGSAAGDPDAAAKDYFVERDGMRFAGMHLLADIWGAAAPLDDPAAIDRAMRAAAEAAGATILHAHFHHFSPNGGVSGVVVLAESHVSIHTWPERDFAAVDVFMCGRCDPYRTLPVLRRALRARRIDISEQRRGRVR